MPERGNTDGDLSAAHLTRRPRIKRYPLAESRMREALQELAKSDEGVPKQFQDPMLQTDELVDVLGFIPSEKRTGFIRDQMTKSLTNRHDLITFAKFTHNIMGHTTLSEKKELLQGLLDSGTQPRVTSTLVALMLNSSRSIESAKKLIEHVGESRLTRFRNAEIQHTLTVVYLTPRLRRLRFPERTSANASQDLVLGRYAVLEDQLAKALDIVQTSPYAKSATSTHYESVIKGRLREIGKQFDRCSTKAERCALYNLSAAKAKFELDYGVMLFDSLDKAGRVKAGWSIPEIRSMTEVFEAIDQKFGKWFIPLNSSISAIYRVRTIGGMKSGSMEIAGVYEEPGIISMADISCFQDVAKRKGHNARFFKAAFAHEFGHGMQNFESFRRVKSPRDGCFKIRPKGSMEHMATLTSAFDEWAALSDWRLIPRKDYKLIKDPRGEDPIIRMKGEDFSQGALVNIRGEEAMLFYDEMNKDLWAYNPRSALPKHSGGKFGPDEEWAVAFEELIVGNLPPTDAARQKAEFFERKYAGHLRTHVPGRFQLHQRSSRSKKRITSSVEKPVMEHTLPDDGRVLAVNGHPTVVYNAPKDGSIVRAPQLALKRSEQLVLRLMDAVPTDDQARMTALAMTNSDSGGEPADFQKLYHRMRTASQAERNTEVIGALAHPHSAEYLQKSLAQYYRRANPALLLAHAALERGDTLGILDPRPNRRGNKAIIDAVNDTLGADIPRKNIYFIGDVTRNGRLEYALEQYIREQKLTEEQAKAVRANPAPWYSGLVIRDFSRGYFIDSDGKRIDLAEKYDKIVAYSSDPVTRQCIRQISREEGVRAQVAVGNPDRLEFSRLWRQLFKEDTAITRRPAKTIRFLPLDGGLIKRTARTYIVEAETEKVIDSVSEYVSQGRADELKKALEEARGEARSIVFDTGEFSDPSKIRSTVGPDLFFER